MPGRSGEILGALVVFLDIEGMEGIRVEQMRKALPRNATIADRLSLATPIFARLQEDFGG